MCFAVKTKCKTKAMRSRAIFCKTSKTSLNVRHYKNAINIKMQRLLDLVILRQKMFRNREKHSDKASLDNTPVDENKNSHLVYK